MSGQRRSARVPRPTARYAELNDMDDSDDSMVSKENHTQDLTVDRSGTKVAKSRDVRNRGPQRAPLQPIRAGLRRSNRMTISTAAVIDSSSEDSEEEEEEEEEDGGNEHDSEFEVDIDCSKDATDQESDSEDESSSDDEPLFMRISRSWGLETKTKRAGMCIDSSDEEEEEEEEMVQVHIKQKPKRSATKTCRTNNVDYSAAVEKILARRRSDKGEDEVRVKFVGQSYRNAAWLPCSALIDAGRGQLLRNFEKRKSGNEETDPDLEDGIHPSWLLIDRVVAYDQPSSSYLVKWKGLGYADATWEDASSLTKSQSEQDAAAVKRYHDRTRDAEARILSKPANSRAFNPNAVPQFCNGRTLRPYQLESLAWMAKHWRSRQNCILGDEMGLGKTAQSISVMAFQRQFGGVQGPFLVIAPLTTLGHWQREIETWTDMDCIVYAGSAADREVAEKWDLWVDATIKSGKRNQKGRRAVTRRMLKPHVVLTSYETVLRGANLFRTIRWETVIIDEAHRMKSKTSSTREVISSLDIHWLLLLTGTPVQNNMCELFGLLNLLDPIEFFSEEGFLEKYGDEKTCTPEQIKALQAALKPLLLRRMKEDVETLPEKEECIIWTQLTLEQRGYYKAIFEGQIAALMAGAKPKNLPNLRNLAMELRKVCCHPFLCNGLEDDMHARRKQMGKTLDEVDAIVGASGKMLLLHKLLPKLRAEGHKVLIFSQFKMMLDVLEDYLNAVGMPMERIDGSTSSRDRQAAIDRFSRQDTNDKDSFIFLLSTKAGGQGITLTAADTCIIYDSDWNPQNDLQAMARCHRIGQEKDVTIYRLVSKDTYEEHVFRTSSRKYGLDEAILGGIGGGNKPTHGAGTGGDPEADGHKIAQLLKHGAHCLDKMEEAAAETEAFAAEDIDEILKGRTEKRAIGGRAGNTFSIATFEVPDIPENDKDFWSSLLPEAAAREEEQRKATAGGLVLLAPRRRKRINYSEFDRQRGTRKDDDDDSDVKRRRYEDDEDYEVGEEEAVGSGGDSDSEYGADDGVVEGEEKKVKDGVNHKPEGTADACKTSKTEKAKNKESGKSSNGMRLWSINDVNTLLECMLRFGNIDEEPDTIIEACGLERKGYKVEEISSVMTALLQQLQRARGPPGQCPVEEFNPPSLYQEKNEQRRWMFQKYIDGEINYDEIEELAAAKAREVIECQKRMKELAMAATIKAVVNNAAQFPPAADKALRDPKLADKLVKYYTKYQRHLKERSVLRDWWDAVDGSDYERDSAEMTINILMGRFGKNLPGWWTCEDSKELFQACFELGWDAGRKGQVDVENMLTSSSFKLCERVVCDTTLPETAPPTCLADKEVTFPVALNTKQWVNLKEILSRFIRAALERFEVVFDDALIYRAGHLHRLTETKQAIEAKSMQVSNKPQPSHNKVNENQAATERINGDMSTKDPKGHSSSHSEQDKQAGCTTKQETNGPNNINCGEDKNQKLTRDAQEAKKQEHGEVKSHDEKEDEEEEEEESSIMYCSASEEDVEVIEVMDDDENDDDVNGQDKESLKVLAETKTPGSPSQPALKVFGSYTNPLSGVPPKDVPRDDETKGNDEIGGQATLKKMTKQHKQYSLFEMSQVQKNWQKLDRVVNQSNQAKAEAS